MTSLLCMGDLHLGAGTSLGAPGERLAEQAAVLDEIFLLAKSRNVQGILNAGDTFEGREITPEELDVFAGFVASCATAGIPVLAITGNGRHDAAVRTTNGMQIFSYMPGITVHAQPSIQEISGVAVATLPWVPPGRLVAARNGGDRDQLNRDAADLLVDIARGLRAQISAEQLAVLMLHWSVSGASTPTGALTDLFREPVLEWLALDELGFDAIVMGHIHAPQFFLGDGSACRIIYHKNGEPTTTSTSFYVGSPMPLNFGEAACAHGVWILDVDAVGTTAEFVPIESRRFVTVDYDFVENGVPDQLDIEIGLTGTTPPFVKMRYRAIEAQARRIDNALLKRSLEDAGAHKVWIQPDVIREDRARAEGLDEQVDDVQAFELWCDANLTEMPDGARARLRDRHRRYLEELAA